MEQARTGGLTAPLAVEAIRHRTAAMSDISTIEVALRAQPSAAPARGEELRWSLRNLALRRTQRP
jgi:hypothetical protein